MLISVWPVVLESDAMKLQHFLAFTAVCAAACLTPVQEKWCDTANPCSPGFVCTSDFHCVSTSRVDGGTGGSDGGTGGGGGVTGGGGGVTGGGGGVTGGGGGSTCSAVNCAGGCCGANGVCVPVTFQDNSLCGNFGQACMVCGTNSGCVNGQCVPVVNPIDAGVVGAPCTSDPVCGNDGLSFCIPEISGGQPTGFAGGYCSRFCDNTPCPVKSTCVQAQASDGSTVHICLASCMSQMQCRMGYGCDSNVCTP